MDNSIIFTSSVQIGNSLGLTPAALSWVSSAYTLTFGGLLLLSGRLSDLIWRKTLSPLLPLVLFKNKIRSVAYITRLLFMMTMLPFWFLPQMMQNQYGFSALESGFAFLPLTIVNFIIALQLTKLTMKFGNNMVLLLGK